MSAKDIFHQSVKKAIQKEGWNITHDPMYISIPHSARQIV